MRLTGAVLLCCLLARLAWAGEAAERLLDFDIAAQPLSGALLQFSAQSGIQMLLANERVAERRAPAVRGRMTSDQALQRLLADSGLSFRRTDAGTIVLVRASAGVRTGAPGARAPPLAQQSAEVEDALGEVPLMEIPEVVVTGTRIQVPGNFTAPNPMLTITGEDLRLLGIVNVADAITTLVPQNIPSYMPTLTGDDQEGSIGRNSFFIGNTIANLRGMDPTFGTRTLTLIDGRRVVSTSNQADVVDMHIIPSNLLQRMDVATGGASATYGSGAMAGVVNLVLDSRMTGLRLDVDYGVTEAGDGGNPHLAISGGTAVAGGRGHLLMGLEWQDQSAIRDCARARRWCEQSRTMYQNFSGTAEDASQVLAPLPGFEHLPARFRMDDYRYSQYAPAGSIYSSDASNTSGFRFSDDGTGIEQYAYGYRGGSGRNTTGGDGPLLTRGLALLPRTERRTLFTNFEYALTDRMVGYLQGSHADVDSLNRNRATMSNACVRFNTTGVPAQPGGSARTGDFIAYGGGGEALTDVQGAPLPQFERNPLWSNASFVSLLGLPPSGRYPPYYVVPGTFGSSDTAPPQWEFDSATSPQWQRVRSVRGTHYWNLVGVTMAADFEDLGLPAVLPQLGRNAYAFLPQLSPEALHQLQSAFGNSTTTGSGPGLDNLYGTTPCTGHTAVRKVWNPQIQQWTEQQSRTTRAVAGLRGRLGGDWRWETYYQYGQTRSTSRQNNVPTNLSFAFAMDAVIDDRQFIDGAPNPDWGRPVCRITRDGVPVLDAAGRPTSDPAGLAELAAGCRPLNIFGTRFATPEAAALQQEALAYAFKDNVSDGHNSLHVLSFATSGTLWQGPAGPVTAAFGLELREDRVDNRGSRGPLYLRADISRAWGDAFGGRTRVAEGYTELNLPLVSGREGMNLWSMNAALRHASYHNKGGAGTTGQSASQGTLNWKLSTVYEPFDFMRLRLTRSRDLRAAGYRDLFINQPGVPDSIGGQQARNPWRDRTADSQENQYERWGTVNVGNADLKPEKSDTLTLGMVVAPGGWAQGMRLSADYYTIRVRDGIYTPYAFTDPVLSCWERSGNVEARYIDGAVDPAHSGINGRYDADLPECREITFATDGAGGLNLHDILSYNTRRPVNGLPYRRRGVDLAWNYTFPLQQAGLPLPGLLSLTARGTRALESSGLQHLCALNTAFDCEDTFIKVDTVGQIRSNVFIPGVSAAPRWTGNIIASYRLRDLAATLAARYVGGARLDNTWSDDPASPRYMNDAGQLLYGSVDDNRVDPYLNFSLNGSYRLGVPNIEQFELFASINNLFDKSPPFTGGGISGASAQYHDTLGRAYRLGVRIRF